MIGHTKYRVLLCTSPLQVVIARSAMDYMQEQSIRYRDYLIIVHPVLTERSRELIREIGGQLGFNVILDFSDELANITDIIEKRYACKSLPFYGRSSVQEKDNDIRRWVKAIKEVLYQETDTFHEVYLRKSYAQIEKLFLRSLLKKRMLFGIDDGLGDYISKLQGGYIASISHVNKIIRLIVEITRSNLGISNYYNLPYLCVMKAKFSMLAKKDSIVIDNNFKENLNKLRQYNNGSKRNKIIIIGSVIDVRPKYNMTTEKEVEIYNNNVIPLIKERHGVDNDSIYYKPHPRTTYEAWKYKKKHLNCGTYDYYNNPLFEIELASNIFKAVYSIGSTSLLLAKTLFGIDAYWIDLRRLNVHPTHMNYYNNVFSRYGVKIQHI